MTQQKVDPTHRTPSSPEQGGIGDYQMEIQSEPDFP